MTDIWERVLQKMGNRPDRITVDVLLDKGGKLEGIVVVPGKGMYVSEEKARVEMEKGDKLYRVNVYRVE